ncbi:alpha/beta hydrolase [Actinosynnema pretiosum]|uniref:Peptidase n=1 Tax=Actinosynnema pretiosum TaxID=42197 RepID=A0A290Z5T2_9PSEU|nr:alpha/beta hydrolase [Actinosynnema pretiosum]ATE54323.1 peptidase [Actinosynnema pretiosum]
MQKRLVLAVGLALVAGATPAVAESAQGGVPARYTAQRLDWHLCAPEELTTQPPAGLQGLECATFRTPRDWDRPREGRDLTIAVSRLKATHGATASLLTNPGGPGGDGRYFPAAPNFTEQTRLREHQEIIGVDVRGTGKSTNVTCDGAWSTLDDLDARDRSPENLDHALDLAERAADTCQAAYGDLGPVINTHQTIHDYDLLRALLGRERINWVGYSGGTWLGAHYAQRFPQRTGRFVLDSNTEFTTTWQKSFDWQATGFERSWREHFLPWAAKHDDVYHLGADAESVRQVYEAVRAALVRRPVELPSQQGPFRVTAPVLDGVVTQSLYSKVLFEGLATFLVTLKGITEQGSAPQEDVAAAVAAAELAADEPDAMRATFWATLCGEGEWTGDRRSAIRDSNRAHERGLTLVGSGWPLVQLCMFWDSEPRALPKLDGRGVPPVLMLHSELDGATPIEGARRAHAAFEGSRLITVTGDGDHGLYGMGNPVVDEITNAYLVDGVVPADREVAGMPLPDPSAK